VVGRGREVPARLPVTSVSESINRSSTIHQQFIGIVENRVRNVRPEDKETIMADTDNFFEINKQLTTLSAGSTVLIATFLKDIFPQTETGTANLAGGAKLAILVAFLAFLGATAAAVLAMLPNVASVGRGGTLVSVGLFCAGILVFSLVVYLSLNVPSVALENPQATEPVTASP